MQRNLLARYPNLLSRSDRNNENVLLKRSQVLETDIFKSLLKSPNALKQLRLHSRNEVVFLDLHRVLHLSPFLSNLLTELKDCCFSPHDNVHISLDQFPPNLLYLIKNLLEKGECAVQSRLEEEQLGDLIKAIGMDKSLQLYCKVDESSPTLHNIREVSFVDLTISDADENVHQSVQLDWLDDAWTSPSEELETGQEGENERRETDPTSNEGKIPKRLLDDRSFNANHIKMCQVNVEKINVAKCKIEILDSQTTKANKIPSHKGKYFGRITSAYCRPRKKNTENFQCRICRAGDFNKNNLYLHLYRRHEHLRKLIHQSFVAKFSEPSESAKPMSFYTLEKEKKYCFCPICGKEMKATRTRVGIHWAVYHKKIRPFYISHLMKEKKKLNASKPKKKRSKIAVSLNHEDHPIKEENTIDKGPTIIPQNKVSAKKEMATSTIKSGKGVAGERKGINRSRVSSDGWQRCGGDQCDKFLYVLDENDCSWMCSMHIGAMATGTHPAVFKVGSVVTAGFRGEAPWPGMVDFCPDTEMWAWPKSETMEGTEEDYLGWFHVTYFSNPPTRCQSQALCSQSRSQI